MAYFLVYDTDLPYGPDPLYFEARWGESPSDEIADQAIEVTEVALELVFDPTLLLGDDTDTIPDVYYKPSTDALLVNGVAVLDVSVPLPSTGSSNLFAGANMETQANIPFVLDDFAARSSEQAKAGTWSLKLSPDASARSYKLDRVIEVKNGDVLFTEFSAFRAAGYDGTAATRITFKEGGTATVIDSITLEAAAFSGDGVWDSFRKSITMPDISTVDVYIEADHAAGAFYLDAMESRRVAAYTEIGRGAVVGGALASYDVANNLLPQGDLAYGITDLWEAVPGYEPFQVIAAGDLGGAIDAAARADFYFYAPDDGLEYRARIRAPWQILSPTAFPTLYIAADVASTGTNTLRVSPDLNGVTTWQLPVDSTDWEVIEFTQFVTTQSKKDGFMIRRAAGETGALFFTAIKILPKLRGGQLEDESVGNDQLAPNSVSSVELQENSVGWSELTNVDPENLIPGGGIFRRNRLNWIVNPDEVGVVDWDVPPVQVTPTFRWGTDIHWRAFDPALDYWIRTEGPFRRLFKGQIIRITYGLYASTFTSNPNQTVSVKFTINGTTYSNDYTLTVNNTETLVELDFDVPADGLLESVELRRNPTAAAGSLDLFNLHARLLNSKTASNANGTYQKHPDGNLECRHTLTLTYANGSSLVAPWTFPLAFSNSDPIITATEKQNSASYTPSVQAVKSPGAYGTIDATQADIRIFRISGQTNFQAGDTAVVYVEAKGRWFT